MRLFFLIMFLAASIFPASYFVLSSVPPSHPALYDIPSGPQLPVRIAVIYNPEASTPENELPECLPSRLTPLFDLLKRNGGELAMGVATEERAPKLLRLHIASPPQQPALLPLSDNPSLRAEQERQYNSQAAGFALDLATSLRAADHRIQRFLEALTPFLATPMPSSRNLDGALTQAAYFLNEQTEGPQALRFAVLISGREDTILSILSPVTSGPAFVVVNPTGKTGVPGGAQPLVFTHVEDAFHYIVQQANRIPAG